MVIPKSKWTLTPENWAWTDEDLTDPGSHLLEPGERLLITLPEPAEVAGVALHWGKGFAKQIAVRTSPDGKTWQDGTHSDLGEGRMDLLLFSQRQAKFVEIILDQTANPRGIELTEIDLLDLSQCPHCTHPQALDGQADTFGTAKPGEEVRVTFPEPVDFASVRLDWGQAWATQYTVEISLDGENWDPVGEILTGNGSFDNFYWRFRKSRFLRIKIQETSAPTGAQLNRIWFRLSDRDRRPIAWLAEAAQRHPWGVYPPSLQDRQVYWTLVGTPDHEDECLLDEFGNLELGREKPMLTAHLWTEGSLLSLCDAEHRTHSLVEGWMPIPQVSGTLHGLEFTVCAEADWDVAHPVRVTYQLKNLSSKSQTGSLILGLRPMQVNPEWQHGGVAKISHLGLFPEGTVVDQGRELFQLLTEPDAILIGPWQQGEGDIFEHLVKNDWDTVFTSHKAIEGLESAAFRYDFELAPSETQQWQVDVPLGGWLGTAPDGLERNNVPELWQRLTSGKRIELPDPQVTNTLATQIPLILVNQNGMSLQPGSRNYDRTWIRDGSHQIVTLLQAGIVKQPLAYLSWYSERVQEEGLVPPILNPDGSVNTGHGSNLEFDAQGQFIFAVAEAYRLTRDRRILQDLWPAVRRALDFLQKLEVHDADPRFDGLLKPSISHEGYSKPTFSYWDDFWGIRGWADGAFLAGEINDLQTYEWATQGRARLAEAVRRSMETVIADAKLSTIPSSAENADFDPTSTAIAFWPCECADVLPPNAINPTYDRLVANIRLREGHQSWRTTPYEIRNISALLALGREDDATDLMDHMLSCQRPKGWNHWAEVIIGDERYPDYIGDMPHTWIGSEFWQAIRRMLVQERGTELYLLPTLPKRWRNGPIRLTDLPTHFGLLTLHAEGGNLSWELKSIGHPKPSRVVLPEWSVEQERADAEKPN